MNDEFTLPEVNEEQLATTGDRFLDNAIRMSTHVMPHREGKAYLRKLVHEFPSNTTPGMVEKQTEIIMHVTDPVFGENVVLRFYWETPGGAYRLTKVGLSPVTGRPIGKTVGRQVNGKMLYIAAYKPTIDMNTGEQNKPASYDEFWVNWGGRVEFARQLITENAKNGLIETIDHAEYGLELITDEELTALRNKSTQPAAQGAANNADPFADSGY